MPVKRYKIRFTGCNYSLSTAFLPVSGLKNILFFKKLTAGIKKAVQAVCCTAFFSGCLFNWPEGYSSAAGLSAVRTEHGTGKPAKTKQSSTMQMTSPISIRILTSLVIS